MKGIANSLPYMAGVIALSAICIGEADAAPGAAQADVSPAVSANTSGDIIVTARRTDERLQDVPISIKVFNQAQLDSKNITNAQNLAAFTPSLSVNNNFGSDNTSFAIRGFIQDAGTPPSVGTYFADVVVPRGPTQGTLAGDGAGPGDFFDLENVQILKGPQGTLFGRNTTGGAVLFVPRKPTAEFDGYIEASYGNYDMKRVQAAINIPLSDVARLRVSMDHQDRNGYLVNNTGIGPRRFGDVDYTAGRASLVVDLMPNLENYTIASYSVSDNNGPLQKIIGCNPSAAPANFLGRLSCAQITQQRGTGFYTLQNDLPDPRVRLEIWSLINTTTWKASDSLTIKNIVSYSQLKDSIRSALFGTDYRVGSSILPFSFVEPISTGNSANESTFTEEMQLQGSASDNRLTYQAGGYLEIAEPLGLVGNQSPTLISCSSVLQLQCTALLPQGSSVGRTAGETSTRTIGAYAQASYSITGRLKLTAGVRYTWDQAANDSSRLTFVFPTPNMPVERCTDATAALPICNQSIKEKSSAPTWLADLDYKPNENLLLYAKYSRGYRTGGIFANAPSNYRVFKPEKVDAYEAGLKWTLRGRLHGTFDVTGFYNNFSNQQLSVGFNAAPGAPVSATTGIVNAGQSRIYGAELESSISPFKGFTIDGSYTYLHTEILRIDPLVSNDPNFTLSAQISPGDALLLSPKDKLSVTGAYTLGLSHSSESITLGATFTHVDRERSSYAYNNPVTLAAYGSDLANLAPLNLLNLNLDWKSAFGHPVDISLFATNVTQKHYYAFVPGLAGSGFESAVLGEPRMIGARVRYHFGK
jgi:iron complex outermembrane receptor protein